MAYFFDGNYSHDSIVYRKNEDFKSEMVVVENGIMFQVNLLDKLDTGIFLDMKLGRKWIMENSNNKRVLNLFSYSCLFGCAAMLGGGSEVINVDASKTALGLGRINYRLNGLKCLKRAFCRSDVARYIRFTKKKNFKFDIIIIDPSPPPSIDIDEKLHYYNLWFRRSLPLIGNIGSILISCHDMLITEEFINILLQLNQENLKITLQESIPYPESFNIMQSKAFVFKIERMGSSTKETIMNIEKETDIVEEFYDIGNMETDLF